MEKITFEIVYSNEYVRESINVLMANLIRQYPGLQPERDDIQQQLLLILDRQIPRFNPEKSSIERFARITLESGVREVRRSYFGKRESAKRNLTLSADQIPTDASYENDSKQSEFSEEMQQVLKLLSPVQREICDLLCDGTPLSDIGKILGIGYRRLKSYHLPEIRRVLKNKLF